MLNIMCKQLKIIEFPLYNNVHIKQSNINKTNMISFPSISLSQIRIFFRYFYFLKEIMKHFFEISTSFDEINRFKYKFKLKVLLELSQSISLLPIVNIESGKSRSGISIMIYAPLSDIESLMKTTMQFI